MKTKARTDHIWIHNIKQQQKRENDFIEMRKKLHRSK